MAYYTFRWRQCFYFSLFISCFLTTFARKGAPGLYDNSLFSSFFLHQPFVYYNKRYFQKDLNGFKIEISKSNGLNV